MSGKLILAIMATLFLVSFSSCGNDKIPADVSRNQPITSILKNDLAGGKLVQDFDLSPTDCFSLRAEYSTDYISTGWRITDSKTLKMRAMVVPKTLDCRPEVLMEHVHADVSIKSSKEGIDGLKQDSMDDNIHGGTQPGFNISPPYFWEETFAIEGFSQTLISGWSFYYSGFGGGGKVEEKRLSEKNLISDGGACASKFQIVYDLLIRKDATEPYHTRSVVSEFFVPVPGANCAALAVAEGTATATK